MEYSPTAGPMHLITLLILLLISSAAPAASQSPPVAATTDDQFALLSIRSYISDDPSRALASWNAEGSLHLCQWRGVTCGDDDKGRQRVTALDLDSLNLTGSLSPSVANLTFLRRLHLPNNRLLGGVPSELGLLPHLQHLNLSFNSLVGGIPASLSGCSQLQNISLQRNMLQGEIPGELGSLGNLTELSLEHNNLTGTIPNSLEKLQRLQILSLYANQLYGVIPPWIGSIANLTVLYLAQNKLTGRVPDSLEKLQRLQSLSLSTNQLSGVIPPWIGNMSSINALDLYDNSFTGGIPYLLHNLQSLYFLDLSYNSLTGAIPPSLWNLSSLTTLDVQGNNLSGALPMNVGDAFPKLKFFSMSYNNFHGSIPISLSNASKIEYIGLKSNRFSGTIPWKLGTLQNMYDVVLGGNRLEARNAIDWRFLTALANNTNMMRLGLDSNMLGGTLPTELANLSITMVFIALGGNHIYGSIPADIGNLVNLVGLGLESNHLTGTLPVTLARLQSLHLLALSGNNFSGEIPSALGNLTQLNRLYLGSNQLSGNIPPNIGSCPLEYLGLEDNKFTGPVPREILGITSLSIILNLSHNSLSGPLPSEVRSLKQLGVLDISHNKMFGEIPTGLGECQSLRQLFMDDNFFNGSIPSSFNQLKGLDVLDLSHNNMSGQIPQFLEDFHSMTNLNLSFNNFDGQVPEDGVFKNSSAVSLLGNDNLCGGNPAMNLPQCSNQNPRRKHKFLRLALLISAITIAFCLILLFCLLLIRCWIRKSRRRGDFASGLFTDDQHCRVSYADLYKATDGFSSANIIGTGSFCSVYKAILNQYCDVVAVKVINLQQSGASKAFNAECKAWVNTRHRNLVKILTSCSSIDYRGNEFKALVFEFMPNGSLENWLHPEANDQGDRKLSLTQRLNIAIDVAHALDYLHHQGPVPLIHCDLKPSNILLDDDMTARVGDFGLARFLSEQVNKKYQRSASSIVLKGSIGYVPPEYGVGNDVSAPGDIYSYGILVLEMFTGKRPTADVFGGLNIHNFVEMALPEQVMRIADPSLINNEVDGENDDGRHDMNNARCVCDCLSAVLKIGVMCCKESPAERMKVEDIIKDLLEIRDVFFCIGTQGWENKNDE